MIRALITTAGTEFSSVSRVMASFSTVTSPNGSMIPRVLSINSHCVHGYVGNKAATFPLQCMGFDVSAINSTTLSNRHGYPWGVTGRALPEAALLELLKGLKENDLLDFDIVISGYMTSPELLCSLQATLDMVRKEAANAFIVCDPVLGDHGRFYVPEELLSIYKDLIIPRCNLVAPNAFEAEVLTNVAIKNVDSAREACRRFHAMGADYCLLKGVRLNGASGPLSMILSCNADKQLYCIDFPRIEGVYYGCGDLCTAIASAWLFTHKENLPLVLEKVSGTMNAIISEASSRAAKELPVIESRDIFHAPPAPESSAYPVHGDLLGVIFDMDGTLTEPGAINFAAMYDRIGIKKKKGVDILTQITQDVPVCKHEEAHAIIVDEELKGCDAMELRPDLGLLLKYLIDNDIKAAISTRNCGEAYLRFRDKAGFHDEVFTPVLSRESLGGINKPDPQVAQHILESWDAAHKPNDVWFVGDSMDDMMCGKGAGCRTCLISPVDESSSYTTEQSCFVDICVTSLSDFLDHLRFHDVVGKK